MAESREREAFEKWFDANYSTIDPIAKQTIFTAWQAGRVPLMELLEEAKHVSQTIRMYMRDDFRYLDERDRSVLDELESLLERIQKETA